MQKIISSVVILACSLTSTAQVPVRLEPRHHNVFENDFVRILDVYFSPGDTTQYHVHHTPSVFINYTKTKTGSELMGNAPVSGISEAGSIKYDSLLQERVHRVWNEDSTWFHVMDIELTGKSPKGDLPVLKNDMMQLLYNEQQANIYKLQIPPSKQSNLASPPNGLLIVSLSKADVTMSINHTEQHRLMQAGHYTWIDAGSSVNIENKGSSVAGFAVLQLK